MGARARLVIGIVAALALAGGCKPDNGYAVDVTVSGKRLPADVAAAVRSLVEDVSGAESWSYRYDHVPGLAHDADYIYRPRIGGGALVVSISAFDAGGRLVAHGAGDVKLAPAKTVFLEVTLDVAAPPPPDLAMPTDPVMPPDLGVPQDLGMPRDLAEGNDGGVVVDTVCHDACARLIGCGVHEKQESCEAGCGPLWHACAAAAGSDCNAIALCNYRQFAMIWCGGLAGGYPSGTATCATTSMCEGACNLTSPTAQCTCACAKQLDPARALDSVVHVTCAGALCPQCTPDDMGRFNGAACNACAKNVCNDHCMSN